MRTERETLRAVGIFAELTDAQLEELAGALAPRSLKAGEVLMVEGDVETDVHIVANGRLRVTRQDGEATVHLGDLLPGECVGEMALLKEAPRTATVTALVPSMVLDLPCERFRTLLKSSPEARKAVEAQVAYRERWTDAHLYRPSGDEVVDRLEQMLPGTPRALLEQVEPEVQWVAVPRGTVLMRQGDRGDSVYFVLTGRLSAYASRDDGSRVHVGDVGPGESVGEMALLGDEPRSATVEALTDCELLRLSKEGFDHLLSRDPSATVALARLMADRLRERLRARSFVAQLRTVPLISVEECEDVVATQHLELRNLKVTEAYYRLSVGMTLLIGHAEVSWMTFATNASKTVGTFIRREAVPLSPEFDRLQQVPGISTILRAVLPLVRSAPVAGDVVDRIVAAIDDVSDEISGGNIKVFSELGPIFARFIAEHHEHVDYDLTAFEVFLDTLGLRKGPSDAGGQDTLREALSCYYEAMFQAEPKRKSELILLANFKTGMHEQIRLQPNIKGAMDAPLTEGLFEVLDLGPLTPLLREPVMRAWRHFATKAMMQYQLPYGSISVSGELPPLPTGRRYPDTLTTLEHPELARVAARFHGWIGRRWFLSRDWADLEQRMDFIFELFRTRQKSLELFDPPFLYDQRLAISSDEIPTGQL